jgi:hypothetical protein
VVDAAIAANFIRELTEDQFAQQQRVQRRNAAASRTAQRSDAAPQASGRKEATRMGRAFARLAQVRG